MTNPTPRPALQLAREINAVSAGLADVYRALAHARATKAAQVPGIKVRLTKANASLVQAGDAWQSFTAGSSFGRIASGADRTLLHLSDVIRPLEEAAHEAESLSYRTPDIGDVAVRRACDSALVLSLALGMLRRAAQDLAIEARLEASAS